MAKDKDIVEVSILIFSKTMYVFIFDFYSITKAFKIVSR